MKLKDVRDCYDYHTEKAGNVGRQLAFGGIAVVWLLHGPASPFTFPILLLWALGGFFSSLAFDFLHYLIASAIWGIFSRTKETYLQDNGISPESNGGEFLAPDSINFLALFFYWAKAATLVGAGGTLVVYMTERIVAA